MRPTAGFMAEMITAADEHGHGAPLTRVRKSLRGCRERSADGRKSGRDRLQHPEKTDQARFRTYYRERRKEKGPEVGGRGSGKVIDSGSSNPRLHNRALMFWRVAITTFGPSSCQGREGRRPLVLRKQIAAGGANRWKRNEFRPTFPKRNEFRSTCCARRPEWRSRRDRDFEQGDAPNAKSS